MVKMNSMALLLTGLMKEPCRDTKGLSGFKAWTSKQEHRVTDSSSSSLTRFPRPRSPKVPFLHDPSAMFHANSCSNTLAMLVGGGEFTLPVLTLLRPTPSITTKE